MTEGSTSGHDSVRIGTAERDAAIKALDEHMTAGRLDAEEYGERSAKVYTARTWGDITPLFADLPEPRPGPDAPRPRSPRTMVPAQIDDLDRPHREVARRDQGKRALGGALGDTAAALVPFAALALFFVTKEWFFFLLIPVAMIIIYGGGRDGWGNGPGTRR